jgi:hypothetical protein
VLVVLTSPLADSYASDHTDPPSRVFPGEPEDLGDLYAWVSNDTLSVVLTFAGRRSPGPGETGTWDPDLLYGVHIDTNGDGTAEHDIFVRFGQDEEGAWGMQVLNFPGAGAPLIGLVDTVNEGAGGKFYAGYHDEPTFFDASGLAVTQNRIADGNDETDVGFTGADAYAGLNTSAIVLDIPVAAALDGGTSASIWATSASIGGE